MRITIPGAQRQSMASFNVVVRIVCVFLLLSSCVLGCLGLFPRVALAANSAFDSNTDETSSYVDAYTGNAFLLERDVSNTQVGGDLYWLGDTLNAQAVQVGANNSGGSFLAAGRVLTISNVQIQNSFRAVAETMTLSQMSIGNNITVAGGLVTIASNVSANGLYAAGETLDIAGTYAGGILAGGTVTLTAQISGDMSISAETIVITKDTQIDGTLTVPTDANLTIEEGAQVGNVAKTEPVFTQTTGLDPIAMFFAPLLFSCVAHLLLMMLYGWLMCDSIRKATEASRDHLGKILLYGLLAFIAAPFVALFFIALLVTAPIGVLMLAVMALLWLFSIPFVGYVLGKSVFKKMSEKRAGVIGVLALTVLCYVPGLFVVVPSLCAMFTAGYVIDLFVEKRRKQKIEKAPEKVAEVEGDSMNSIK